MLIVVLVYNKNCLLWSNLTFNNMRLVKDYIQDLNPEYTFKVEYKVR